MVNIRLLLLFLVTYCNSNSCNISCNSFLIFVAFLFTCFGFISSFNTLFNIINLLLVKNEKIKGVKIWVRVLVSWRGEITVVWILAYSVITRALPVAMSLPKMILSTPFSEFQPFIARNNSKKPVRLWISVVWNTNKCRFSPFSGHNLWPIREF